MVFEILTCVLHFRCLDYKKRTEDLDLKVLSIALLPAHSIIYFCFFFSITNMSFISLVGPSCLYAYNGILLEISWELHLIQVYACLVYILVSGD
jgi:hypothetical protein